MSFTLELSRRHKKKYKFTIDTKMSGYKIYRSAPLEHIIHCKERVREKISQNKKFQLLYQYFQKIDHVF